MATAVRGAAPQRTWCPVAAPAGSPTPPRRCPGQHRTAPAVPGRRAGGQAGRWAEVKGEEQESRGVVVAAFCRSRRPRQPVQAGPVLHAKKLLSLLFSS